MGVKNITEVSFEATLLTQFSTPQSNSQDASLAQQTWRKWSKNVYFFSRSWARRLLSQVSVNVFDPRILNDCSVGRSHVDRSRRLSLPGGSQLVAGYVLKSG